MSVLTGVSAQRPARFNPVVAIAVGGLVWQIARALGMNSGALTVVFLLVPWALLVRYGKKQSPQAYAGIIGALVVVFGIAIAAGPGDVFIPPSSDTRQVSPTPSASCVATALGAPLKDVRSCAEQGDARAQLNLGAMYALGFGVPEEDRTRIYVVESCGGPRK